MKTHIHHILLTLAATALSHAEVHTLKPIQEGGYSQTIHVAADEYFRVLYVVNAGLGEFLVAFEGESEAVYGTEDYSAVGGPTKLTLKGPLTVRTHGPVTIATIEVLKSAPASTPQRISNAVVIPSDAAGPVEIILESSQDLISWLPALPGTYGGSTSNRFFRVRAEMTTP